MSDTIVREVIDRIPALRDLRGYARIEVEEVLNNAFADVIAEYIEYCEMEYCEMVASSGGAP